MRKLSNTIGSLALAAALFLNPAASFAASAGTSMAGNTPLPFKDVQNSPELGQILLLDKLGLVKGYSDHTFKPANSITRAEFVTMLVNGEGHAADANSLSSAKSSFSDVSGWPAGYINFALRNGWVQGTGNGAFHPNQPITNAQAVAILMNSIGVRENNSTAPWYADYYLDDQKYHFGFVSPKLKPEDPATRAYVAELIVKLLTDIPFDPSTGLFDKDHPEKNTEYALQLYEDVINDIKPSAGTSYNDMTLLNGQVVELAPDAAVYGDLSPGSSIWYFNDETGLAVFVYGVSANQDDLNRTGEFGKLLSVYQMIKYNYYRPVEDNTLVNGAIDGMLKSLDDPYTTYMPPAETEDFQNAISSSFEGIGTSLKQVNGDIVIDSTVPDSPAQKAGLKANDIILKVDGDSVKGMNANDVAAHIRGLKGTKVELVIQRPGTSGELTISVTRDTITQKTVTGQILADGIGKITISQMSEPTFHEFNQMFASLKSQGMKGLILDLRSNPGGLVSDAYYIANQLLPNQKTVFQFEYRDGTHDVFVTENDMLQAPPIVVLTNGNTASAAEILTAALKESGGAILVGGKTYGKGVAQETKGFSDGSSVKYTGSKWLTPNGNWIQHQGIAPDYAVDLPSYAYLSYIDPAKELAPDTVADEIKTAQQMLKAIGFDPGRTDGYYDNQTKQAVISFQASQGIAQTGILKGETTQKLMDALIVKIDQNDTQLQKAEEVLKQKLL